MKKLKHSKFRNTGLIFEILTRFAMREALDPSVPQKAIRIIKKHFHPQSLLNKELRYYQSLSQPTNYDSKELFELTLEGRKSMDPANLLKEKYDLVKSIKKNYNETIFFETKTSNYKITASIYKLFEFTGSENPEQYLGSKQFILEHISGKQIETVNEVEQLVREQDKDVRTLSLKILIEQFNQKYQSLDDKQKTLLSRYINEDPNSPTFKDYVINEVSSVTKELNRYIKTMKNDVSKIKLSEVVNLAETIIGSKHIKEDHLNALMNYYELIKELKK